MSANAQTALNYFLGKGYSAAQAAGIVGNLTQESGLDPTAVGDNGQSVGIAQWNKDRLMGLHNFAKENGGNPIDLNTQLEYINHELSNKENKAGEMLRAAQDVPSAAAAFLGFERPQGYDPSDPSKAMGWKGRLGAATNLHNQYASAGNIMTDATIDDNMTPEQAKAKLAELGYDESGQKLSSAPAAAKPAATEEDMTPEQAKAKLAEMGLDESGQPLPKPKEPDLDTYGGIEQKRRQSEKRLASGDNWAMRNLVDPVISKENQAIGEKTIRSLTSLPLGAIQLGLDNTGYGDSDLAQSIANVKRDSEQQSRELDENFPTHTMDFSHGFLPETGKFFQANIANKLFKAAPYVKEALKDASPLAQKAAELLTNVGIGGGTTATLVGSEAQSGKTADIRNAARSDSATNAGIAGGAIPLAVPALATFTSKVGERMSPLLTAAKRLREVVGADDINPVGDIGPQIPKFFDNINKNSPLAAAVPGYQPTTAQLAQNAGMATLERGARSPSSGDIANNLVTNDVQNKQAIGDLVGSISPQAEAEVPALQEVAANAAANSRSGIANKVAAGENANELAQQLKAQASAEATAAMPTQDRSEASSSMFDKLKSLFGEDRSMKNKLFKAIDPEGTVPVASDQMKQSVQSSLGEISDDEIRNELASHPAIQKIMNLPADISFKQLQEYRPLLSKYLAQARQANDGLLQNVLGGAKRTLESYSDELANGTGGWLFKGESPNAEAQAAAGQRAKEAMDYYANTFSPRWNTGPGKAIAQGIKTFNPVAPEVAGSKFLRPGDSASAAYRNLNEMIKGDPSIAPLAEQHILSDMQQTKGMIDENGIVNPKVLDTWRNKNAELLKNVPSLKEKIDAMHASVKSANDNADAMTKGLKEIHKTAESQETLLNESSIGKVLGKENAADVVGSVMNSDNPVREMNKIVKLANSDKTGRAMKGLQQATYDHLKRIISNTQTKVGAGETANVSLAKLDSYLNRPQKVAALEKILGKDGVEKLMAAREGMRLMSTLSNFQALPGSQTSANTAAAGMAKRMLKGALHVAGGGSQIIKEGVMQVGDALAGRAGDHLNKALLDPDHAKMLLMYNPQHPMANAVRNAANSSLVPAAIDAAQGE